MYLEMTAAPSPSVTCVLVFQPNDDKRSNYFEESLVRHQVRYLGSVLWCQSCSSCLCWLVSRDSHVFVAIPESSVVRDDPDLWIFVLWLGRLFSCDWGGNYPVPGEAIVLWLGGHCPVVGGGVSVCPVVGGGHCPVLGEVSVSDVVEVITKEIWSWLTSRCGCMFCVAADSDPVMLCQ